MGRTETPACRQGPLLPLPCSGPHSTRNMRCPAAYLLLLGRPRPKNQRSTLARFWNVPELSGCGFFLSSSPELLEAHSFPSFGGGTPQVLASSLTTACCPHRGRDLAPPTDPGLRSPVGFFTCGAFQVGTSSSGPQGDTCSQEGSLDPG
uniref:Uncharacterized protein n=1 Tax=Cercocebus atys TaxID=9531 RepID=A0A2K5NUL2_CERAT